jgi:hypothetical protein
VAAAALQASNTRGCKRFAGLVQERLQAVCRLRIGEAASVL